MAGNSIPVEISVFSDWDTGEDFILPTDRELKEEEAKINLAEEEAKENLASSSEGLRNLGTVQTEEVRRMRLRLQRYRESRDVALKAPTCVHRKFTLLKPSMGAYYAAEGSAGRFRDNGDPYVDQSVLMTELLPQCVEGLSPAEVRDLPPSIASFLWQRLYRAIWPDQNRLPICASLSGTT